jgi:hypothetical protein
LIVVVELPRFSCNRREKRWQNQTIGKKVFRC